MNLYPIDQKELCEIKTDWLRTASENPHEVFAADYEQLFQLIEHYDGHGALDDRFNSPIYYAVKTDGSVVALVHLVQTKRGKDVWIKMMDLHMCPAIEANPDNEAATHERLRVISSTLSGLFELTKTTVRADTLKVYGRTDVLVTFLRGMHETLDALASLGNLPGINVSIEGRWLVFRTN